MTEWSLPDGWTVWSDEDGGRAVLVFRPDVFDGADFPAPCMPTIYVSRRSPEKRLRQRDRTTGPWHVSLSLEPEVRVDAADETVDTRREAVAAATRLAERFANGEVTYRDAYQVPREDYLDELDRLTN
ncbi:DUF5820 family protein [Salarchaeum japonicum]|uniref:DUF5820 family protein n=1 Tax=Salarchaeum japonicum TaxID=555573 RepID=A0AAV3SX73_9EURY|nr:DUF5820 family protein [Salarchaeum japonicum]